MREETAGIKSSKNGYEVSVILTTYNGARRGFLREAIDSVVAQSYGSFELLIVDDGSEDGSEEVAKSYIDRANVRYIYQKNRGLAAARNLGIVESRGRYLLFLDDDDLYEKELIAEMVGALSKIEDKRAGMLYCAYRFVDVENRTLGSWYIPAEGDIYERLFYDNYAGSPSGTMVKREVFDRVGLFNEEFLCCEDYEMWIRIAREFHVYSTEKRLLRYRLHGNNMSKEVAKVERWQKRALEEALQRASGAIREKRMDYYRHLDSEYAAKYFEIGDYKNFRRCYRRAIKGGGLSKRWRLKALLSYFPHLTRALFHLYRKKRPQTGVLAE